MRNSLLVVGAFVAGCLFGWLVGGLERVHDWTLYLLYALMFQIGVSVGCSDNLGEILRTFRPKMLLIPMATVGGTLLFSALAAFCLSKWRVTECLAVGSGMGYYSLSSIIITQLKTASLGTQLAAELGIVALLSNVFRELSALLLAPWIRRHFGRLAPISAAGVASVDVVLPTIIRVSGKQMISISLFHGMLIDMSVPVLVPFFCSL